MVQARSDRAGVWFSFTVLGQARWGGGEEGRRREEEEEELEGALTVSLDPVQFAAQSSTKGRSVLPRASLL